MASTDSIPSSLQAAQTLQKIPDQEERTNQLLLKVIRNNFNTKYATQVTSLAEFRDAVSAHGASGTDMDITQLLADFRKHVPLSDYDSYKPFIDKFDAQPCRQDDAENVLAPGIPLFFLQSSATSGTRPKAFPRYDHRAKYEYPFPRSFGAHNEGPIAAMKCTGCRGIKVIEHGEALQRIPIYNVSGAFFRKILGWDTDDESWMSLAVSRYAAPLAATTITSVPSFLVIHALFFLTHKNVCRFEALFAPRFVHLIHHIDEHWDLLVSCIRDGVLPDLEGIDHAREYIQAHFHPNPERAAELREIGPPFSSDGWFSRVWPNAAYLLAVCSGPSATAIPKVRSILGPRVPIRSSAYASSEGGMIGIAYDPSKLDEFALLCQEVVEFLDVSSNEDHEDLRQAWEVEVGKDYEPILTTRDGLWRYRLGDVLRIVGFHAQSKTPLFKYIGRTSLTIHVWSKLIRDDQLLTAVLASSSEDGVYVQEFTAALDDRGLLPTVGFFIELAGPLGPNASLMGEKLHDVLTRDDGEDPRALQARRIPVPTIRIVKTGTFAAYREWKGEKANISVTQIKVPPVLLDPAATAWILERVVQEL